MIAAGRRAGRAVAAVMLVSAAAALPLPAVAGPARAAPAAVRAAPTVASAGPREPVAISMNSVTPDAASPGATLRIRARLRNTGRVSLPFAEVRLSLRHAGITLRSDLDAASGPGADLGTYAIVQRHAVGQLAAGAVVPVGFDIPVDSLALPGIGVYPLAIDVMAAAPTGYGRVGEVRTFLPYTVPDAGVSPLRLAWLWPLIATPDRSPLGSFTDDRLATELGSGGRLGRLLAAAAGATGTSPVAGAAGRGRASPGTLTLVVDPALLDAVETMSRPYTVRPPAAAAVTGQGTAAAQAWLAGARPLAARSEVVAVPYADPDIAALAGAGLLAGLPRVPPLSPANVAETVVTKALGATPQPGVWWPPDGLLPAGALDAVVGAGAGTVLLSATALPPPSGLTFTPGAGTTLTTIGGGTLAAASSDPVLDRLVATGTGGAVLATQRFLAETLIIARESPAASRTLLIAPPRTWNPDPSYAAALLRVTRSAPWLAPATLQDAVGGRVGRVPRGPLTYPAAAQRRELPAAYLGAVAATRREMERFAEILVPRRSGAPDPTTEALTRALWRAESTGWRGHPAEAAAQARALQASLDALTGRVRIVSSGQFTLGSRTGTIPVTVDNGLDQDIRVRLSVESSQARLGPHDDGVRAVLARHQAQITVRTEARSTGTFPVRLQLRTPSGTPYGAGQRVLVRSTAYGTLALAITGGALAFLVLAVAVRLFRRVRALARRRAADARPGQVPG